jgi:hypothetical protein
MNTINPNRLRKALEALSEATRELEQALAEAERPKPDPPPQAVRVYKGPKSRRRAS